MKVAIASDDKKSISHHFGRAKGFVVCEINNKKIITNEYRQNIGGGGCESGGCNHTAMIANIKDCDFVISYGMGMGIYQELMANDITAIVTDVEDVDKALEEFMNDALESNIDKLH